MGAADAPAIWDDLRERCPIAHTDRFGGAWLPTRYDDVAAIAYDTEHFSSRAIIVSNFRPPLRPARRSASAPPISSDPPFHHDARKLLLPGVHQDRRRQAGGGDPRVLPLADRRVRRAGTSSTPPPSTPSTSRCG